MSMKTARERKMSKCNLDARYHQGLRERLLYPWAFEDIHPRTKENSHD